jgi:putative transcriptional regulator
MPVTWNLQAFLRERGITNASQVSRILRDRTGYELTPQAVCDLFNYQPLMLRAETMQALCDAFYCCLSDFFEVKPAAACRSRLRKPLAGDLRNSQTSSKIETQSDRGNDETHTCGGSRQHDSLDFAALFPDARKFST